MPFSLSCVPRSVGSSIQFVGPRLRHHFLSCFYLSHNLPANKEPILKTSWHVSYWFIIGTAPPVQVFMCIHVNTRVLPVVTSLTRVILGQNWYGFTGTCHHVKIQFFFTESGKFTCSHVLYMNSQGQLAQFT